MRSRSFAALFTLVACGHVLAQDTFGVATGLHFSVDARGENIDGSRPIYKNTDASIEDRVNDLLPRMSVAEKVAQVIQGDLNGWMNLNDPLDNTLAFNQTGLEEMMRLKGGSIWGGYLVPYEKFVYAVNVGQKYLMENTTLGIPALIQSEGSSSLHAYVPMTNIQRVQPGRSSWLHEQRHHLSLSDRARSLIRHRARQGGRQHHRYRR
ncbi:hypothetical protein NLJ89_g11857 [Agrocybe chaxingu]|uniref:Uncharacterized protein n=1 Tax=Agrocybe chaxingu TaxID=84603 RepID=A0A9W8JL57_9AGAR|nr:hypothetical protein NLJ89_g11857 [Agrocybe chaxingu]